ncbi:Terminase-like family [uncultured Caudovirales phage]|uniref:Terminase-like family n=1 Tax=uncultured Caudovirales phage TaxID=2100421 RepID=A0A6J7WN17_9CAUD|nr:Terminase-like family [uncultured Caudovirales phage]
MTIDYQRPFLYEYQKAILNSDARFTVTEASTKVGKTASHIIWLFEQALKLKENQSVWWVAPVYAQAEIAFNRMKAQISDKNFFKSNETKLKLTLPTGAIIQFKSAEKPDNLYGDDVYAAVFDEFTRAREEAWFALRSTLTATNGKCKFIGNVKGKKNWGFRLAQRAKQKEQNFEHFRITAYDAAAEGLLSLDEIEQAKRDLPDNVFRELYMAEASDDGSNPFGLAYIQQCCYELSSGVPVCYGIDLAKSYDHTVIIGLDKNGHVCHFDRFQKDWRQTTQTILNLPNAQIAIDSTGVGDPIGEDIARVKDVELFKFTSSSKQQIMEGLALAIQQRKIAFPDGAIKDELDNFEFEYTRTGVKYSAPTGLHDDCVCALALAWHKYRTVGQYSGQYAIV